MEERKKRDGEKGREGERREREGGGQREAAQDRQTQRKKEGPAQAAGNQADPRRLSQCMARARIAESDDNALTS